MCKIRQRHKQCCNVTLKLHLINTTTKVNSLQDYVINLKNLAFLFLDLSQLGDDNLSEVIAENNQPKIIVSRKLKGLMAEHGITMRELSQKTGISQKSLSLKINGQGCWLFADLMLIASHFGFSEVKEVFPEIYKCILET